MSQKESLKLTLSHNFKQKSDKQAAILSWNGVVVAATGCGIMTRQSSGNLRALLCLPLIMASAFCDASVPHNATDLPALTTEGSVTETESESPSIPPSTTTTSSIYLTKSQITTTIKSKSSTSPMVQPEESPNTTSPPGTGSGVSTAVCLILFFCFLILLLFCAYKWYVRNGRPSFPEIWRRVTECVRNAWAVAVTRLRPSSKDKG
ncbi:hypothetical protein QTP86_011230 [Hemibagrus guttatus]|nr:hypothetical protein QTP86_011230 [Hemibagrus guttatus]